MIKGNPKRRCFENVPLAGVERQGRWVWKEQTQAFRLPACSFQQHFVVGFGDLHVQAENDVKEKDSPQYHVQQDWTF